jgi:hypothetical protein
VRHYKQSTQEAHDSAEQPQPSRGQILKHVRFLLEGSGGCVEIRGIGDKSNPDPRYRLTVSGFFDSEEAAVESALPNHCKRTMCIGLNPRHKEMLHTQKANILKPGEGGKNEDVLCRRIFGIDIDTRRAVRRVAASEAELQLALPVFECVLADLESRGIRPITGFSGNGRHLNVLTIPYSASKESSDRNGPFALLLRSFQRRFGSEFAEIDQGVFDAARVWKLYGTAAIKGGNTIARPWRTASFDPPETLPEPIDMLSLYKNEIEEQRRMESKGMARGSAHSAFKDTLDIVELFRGRS